jgi:hypothetical protein
MANTIISLVVGSVATALSIGPAALVLYWDVRDERRTRAFDAALGRLENLEALEALEPTPVAV